MTFEQDFMTRLMGEACPHLVTRPSPVFVAKKPTLSVVGPRGAHEAFMWLEDDAVVIGSIYGIPGCVPSVRVLRIPLGRPGLHEDLRGVFARLG